MDLKISWVEFRIISLDSLTLQWLMVRVKVIACYIYDYIFQLELLIQIMLYNAGEKTGAWSLLKLSKPYNLTIRNNWRDSLHLFCKRVLFNLVLMWQTGMPSCSICALKWFPLSFYKLKTSFNLVLWHLYLNLLS